GCSGRERSVAARQLQQTICAATAEKCALSIGGDVDVEHSGDGGRGSLHPARVHFACAKDFQHILAENVLADAAHQPRRHAPARQAKCAVGADPAATNFQFLREAIFPGLRPGFYAPHDVHVDVTEHDDTGLADCFAAHRVEILARPRKFFARTSLRAAFCDKTGRISEAFLDKTLVVREEVAAALQAGRPVVALESTVIAHGLPRPQNLETARAMEVAVCEAGAVPASIAIIEGRLVAGLSSEQLATFAASDGIVKVSRADLSSVVAARQTGATTVAATMLIAARAGIRIFATGGIGGVHRGAELSFDISADLSEIARTRVAVVCAGAKAILDLPRTLEVLETLGVPVAGYRTNKFPAFYVEDSGLPL